MGLSFWRKKIPEVVKNEAENITVLIQLKNEHIHIKTDWPEPKSDEEAKVLAQNLSLVMLSLSNGTLFDLLMGSLTVDRYKNNFVAQKTVNLCEDIWESRSNPVVPPTQAFQVEK